MPASRATGSAASGSAPTAHSSSARSSSSVGRRAASSPASRRQCSGCRTTWSPRAAATPNTPDQPAAQPGVLAHGAEHAGVAFGEPVERGEREVRVGRGDELREQLDVADRLGTELVEQAFGPGTVDEAEPGEPACGGVEASRGVHLHKTSPSARGGVSARAP